MPKQSRVYGNVRVSIIAGPGCYSLPQTELPALADYTEVELALCDTRKETATNAGVMDDRYDLRLPMDIEDMFGLDGVAAGVTWAQVEALCEFLSTCKGAYLAT